MNMCGVGLLALKLWLMISFAPLLLFLYLFKKQPPGAHFVGGRVSSVSQEVLVMMTVFTFAGDRT